MRLINSHPIIKVNIIKSGIGLVDEPQGIPAHPFAKKEERLNYEDYFMDRVQVFMKSNLKLFFYLIPSENQTLRV